MREKSLTITPPLIDRLKSWSSSKAYLRRWAEYRQLHESEALDRLMEYSATGCVTRPPAPPGMPELPRGLPSRDSYLSGSLRIAALARFGEACQQSLAEDTQQSIFHAICYDELASVLRVLCEAEFPAKFGRNLRMLSIEHAGWAGLAAGAGAVEVVERWAPLLVHATRKGYVLEHRQEGLQHFVLRLWCAANGQEYPDTGYPRYEVADGVLRMWDTPDADMLGQWLVQLCNQHTRLSASRDFMDFSFEFSHCPVEVMMLFRLREQRGLANPVVDHPLMKFLWSRQLPVRIAEPDELLAGVYRRLEQDEGITLQSLYRQLLLA
jgi:hypothetical protein